MQIVIRTDGSNNIGMGHLIRCLSIANLLKKHGVDVKFAVITQTAYNFIQQSGYQVFYVSGNPMLFDYKDGAQLAFNFNADIYLIDTYAVTESFFNGLNISNSLIGYIDDMYTYEHGRIKKPIKWDVDLIVNYGFFNHNLQYKQTYQSSKTHLFLGPKYAPIRHSFIKNKKRTYVAFKDIKTILITSGSTNPNYSLEKMVNGVLASFPEAEIKLVVGSHATFHYNRFINSHIELVKDVNDLSNIMSKCDLAVSAAGTTLYELAAIGVPAVALPIVENQFENALGFEALGLGVSSKNTEWDDVFVSKLINDLVYENKFSSCAKRMCELGVGLGLSEIINLVLS